MVYHIESVARTFYATVHDEKVWDDELEIIKEEFRLCARDAIALLHQNREKSLAEAFYLVASPIGRIELSGAWFQQ